MNKGVPVLYDNKENCCGCSACYASCPQNAIRMEIDKAGFLYPQIDFDKCIKCYLCIKVCPIKNNIKEE